MAGIYIHIPFCKSRCSYCDFYTEVAPHLLDECIDALIKEIALRENYLADKRIDTVYFGGGTPSLLKSAHFDKIFSTIFRRFKIAEQPEITFEANPDDLSTEFFDEIEQFPFNRISIGVQSFENDDLKRINRRHTAEQALVSIENAKKNGFSNISIDLIYGLPFQTLENWQTQVETFLSLDVPHLSAYSLTYEPGTLLTRQLHKGLIAETADEIVIEMVAFLRKKMRENGFDAYEISNYAKKGFRSKHNSAYWKQTPYIGFGPSAHSYDIDSRQWNVNAISEYTHAVENRQPFFEIENLTEVDMYNDYVMLSLRTSEGISKKYLLENFGAGFYDFCVQNIKKYIENQKIEDSEDCFRLTESGILLTNIITTDLIYP
ncbi:MAG: radical SAM family heme chaperone HemW [Prevotellaceae bacterium]|jgi:oxygen-independent coproporphyrinogen-3 oxidase|nr:radical SAM family heme chaperone HemW [Prevotellaceae bacterium]